MLAQHVSGEDHLVLARGPLPYGLDVALVLVVVADEAHLQMEEHMSKHKIKHVGK